MLSFTPGEMQIQTTLGPSVDKDGEEPEQHSHTLLLGCELVQPLCKNVNHYLPNPNVHTLGLGNSAPSRKVQPSSQKTNIEMFIAALFTRVSYQKLPTGPSTTECINKLWDIYVTEYYAVVSVTTSHNNVGESHKHSDTLKKKTLRIDHTVRGVGSRLVLGVCACRACTCYHCLLESTNSEIHFDGGEERKCRELGQCWGKTGLWQGPEFWQPLGAQRDGEKDWGRSGSECRGHLIDAFTHGDI